WSPTAGSGRALRPAALPRPAMNRCCSRLPRCGGCCPAGSSVTHRRLSGGRLSRDGRVAWSARGPGTEGGPVDQLLGAAVEGAGFQQVEVEVAGFGEDRLVAGLGGDHRE